MDSKMEDFKYKKNIERHNSYGSVYDVFLNGEKIGRVQRGPSAPSYWDAWRAFIKGTKKSSGSREKAVQDAYNRSKS